MTGAELTASLHINEDTPISIERLEGLSWSSLRFGEGEPRLTVVATSDFALRVVADRIYTYLGLPRAVATSGGPSRAVAPRVTTSELPSGALFLLEWLSKEDSSAYGECEGADLNLLISAGLATVTDRDHGGWARVSLTADGWATFSRAEGRS